MTETEAKIAVITETWIGEGQAEEDLVQDLSLGSGLAIITRNRHRNSRGWRMEGWLWFGGRPRSICTK